MGCDIHLHAEVKIDNKWEHYAQIPFVRWYAAFEKLAGVRGELSEAIAEPRGLPVDVTRIVAFEYDWDSGHTPSWLGAREIDVFDTWLRTRSRYSKHNPFDYFDLEAESGIYFFGNSFARWTENDRLKTAGVEDVRFVFWFDS